MKNLKDSYQSGYCCGHNYGACQGGADLPPEKKRESSVATAYRQGWNEGYREARAHIEREQNTRKRTLNRWA